MAKQIRTITYNWFYTSEGEGYEKCTVGLNGIIRIEKHDSYYDGPPAHFTVHYEDGGMLDIHNPNTIAWKEVPDPIPSQPDLSDLPF